MLINKNELAGFLDQLMSRYQVFAPVKEADYTNFKQISSGTEATLDYSNTKIPPKGILFPQTEKLFSYSCGTEGAQVQECIDQQKKVVFGIRPCDAKSLVLLDNVFNNDKYQDPYYLTRRENTILVGLGCNRPAGTCFCTSLGGGPFDTTGLDALLVDTGDKYVVEILTERGRELFSGTTLPEAGEADRAAAAAVKETATVSCTVNLDGVKAKLDTDFYDPIWDGLHEKCLGCAVCTYTCPTCHCFDIVDDAVDANGCRVRNWDACMFPLFTLHGSGHNPRPTGKERFRQRVMHKFKYFVDNYNVMACVGCGRCIKNCPVNLDIRAILAEIQGSEARLDK
ncbi:4Fe-4S dicluster domain-containing protein [Desulfotomaculum copahuensis]|uniref:4Fe-4S ferredoxin n=1 Tax=Desulfotomaculum copahuensis TaxID=1838280 RepID=A0A1B7LC72_9FIRM|nr:4Fe-4S dicluster domain-containing protein [Desulfotomaculum copahuensis]OAT80285.1 4Fe-4S ferredoxin [Desulfotomaculum copahuensis]